MAAGRRLAECLEERSGNSFPADSAAAQFPHALRAGDPDAGAPWVRLLHEMGGSLRRLAGLGDSFGLDPGLPAAGLAGGGQGDDACAIDVEVSEVPTVGRGAVDAVHGVLGFRHCDARNNGTGRVGGCQGNLSQ